MKRIMVVDDEEGILNTLRRLFQRTPCTYGKLEYVLEIETFSSPLAALERARVMDFDLVLSDYHMPHLNGIDFLAHMAVIQPDAVRLILSGSNELSTISDTIDRANVYGLLPKPWNDQFLISMIAQALNHRDLQRESQAR